MNHRYLGQDFSLSKKILNLVLIPIKKIKQPFRYFNITSPLKSNGPSIEQTGIHFTQGCFVLSLVEISPVVLEKMKILTVKCLQTNGQIEDGRQAIKKNYFGFQLRLAKREYVKLDE